MMLMRRLQWLIQSHIWSRKTVTGKGHLMVEITAVDKLEMRLQLDQAIDLIKVFRIQTIK